MLVCPEILDLNSVPCQIFLAVGICAQADQNCLGFSLFLSHHFSNSWFCALCNWLPILVSRVFLLSGGCFRLLPFRFLNSIDSFLLAKISTQFLVLSEGDARKLGKKLVLIPSSAGICWLIEREKKSSILQLHYSRAQLNRCMVFITIIFLQSPSC